MLDFRRRRVAARSQALAAASTGVWTDFPPIFAVRLKHCVCPRPLQVLQGTSVATFELHDSQSHRAREGGQDCNEVQQVRMLCFGGINGQGYCRVASQGVNGGGGRGDRTHRDRVAAVVTVCVIASTLLL